VINLFFTWKSIEASPSKFTTNLLQTANAYYPARNLMLSLNIAPINTNVIAVPTDLDTVPFNSLKMIHRYERLLDTVFSYIPNVSLYCLKIGNESDVTLSTNATAWNQFTTFYDSVAIYIKKTQPSLKLGSTLTWGGLCSSNTKSFGQTLNAHSDIISLTYYGVNANFSVKPPSQIPSDFASLLNLYPITPVCFQECGYPTSSTCLSNDSLQRLFVYYVFNAWDYYATRIPLISFFALTDWAQKDVNYYANYYNFHDPVFLGYLGSLGLRTNPGNGTSKPGFEMLTYQMANRNCVTGIPDVAKTNSSFIYPNPFRLTATIQFEEPGSYQIQLIGIGGQILKQMQCSGLNIQVGTETLAPGIYYVKIWSSAGLFLGCQKVVRLGD
jgi:hypothetical protein